MRLLFLLLFPLIAKSQMQFMAVTNRANSQTGYFVAEGSVAGTGSLSDPFTGQQLEDSLEAGWVTYSGATVYLNRGDVFRNQFDVNLNGVRVDAYGTGAQPIISGDIDYSDSTWTNDSGNLYYISLATEPKWVYMGDTAVKISETPWINIEGRPIQLKVIADHTTLTALNDVESLVGAYILCKEWAFRPCFQRTITAFGTGTTYDTLTMDDVPNTDDSGAGVDMPFKLQNKVSFIDQVGEWAYDASAERLYILTGGGAPTNVKIGVRDYGFYLADSVNNIHVENLKFEHQFLEGFYSFNGDNNEAVNCTFSDIRTNAASWRGNGTNMKFNGNTVKRIGNNGVHIGGIIGGEVIGNTFDSLGVQDGPSIPQYDYFKSVGVAVHERWDNTATVYVASYIHVAENTVAYTGYSGMVIVGLYHTVEKNYITKYCQRWNDGGGIYVSNVYGVIYGHGSFTEHDTIRNNIIYDGLGSDKTLEGVPDNMFVHGIYNDSNCRDNWYLNNTVKLVEGFGIHIGGHNMNHTIRYNKVSEAGTSAYSFYRKNISGFLYQPANGHTFEYNTAGHMAGGRYVLYLSQTDYNPFGDGGNSDYNSFYNPFGANMVYVNSVKYTIETWQALFGTDANTVTDLTKRTAIDSAYTHYNVLTQHNYSPDTVTVDLSGDYYLGPDNTRITSYDIPPYDGMIVIRDYEPEGTLLVDDTFTGDAGNITGHTPDTGGAWTVASGTHSLDGSGNLTTSSNGTLTQTTTSQNFTIETTSQFSSNSSSISCVGRWVGDSDRIYCSYNKTSGQAVIGIDGSAVQTVGTGSIPSTATDYTIKFRLKDGTATVWVDGWVRAELINNGTIAAKNISTFNAGLVHSTILTTTRTRIWDE